MSRTKSREHTSWKPKLSDKPIIKRIREHPRHTVKRRLRLTVSKVEMEPLDVINPLPKGSNSQTFINSRNTV